MQKYKRKLARTPAPQFCAGLSLIELIVAIAVLAVLSTLALPALDNLLTRHRAHNAASALFADLLRARSEAIRTARPVVLCASADGTTCGDDDSWHEGWLMIVGDNTNGTIDPGETHLTVHAATPNIRIGWRTGNPPVTFRPSSLYFTNGTFTFCTPGTTRPLYTVVLSGTSLRMTGSEDAASECPLPP